MKLSSSQLDKLKCAIENKTEVVSGLSSNMVCADKTNFPHKLLLANDKLQIFVKPWQIIYQLILSYQKLKFLR